MTSAERVSVIIPVYNEARTVASLIRRVRAVPLNLEIVTINDASSDGSHRRPQPDVHSRQGFAAAGRHLGHHSYLVHLGQLSGFWGPKG